MRKVLFIMPSLPGGGAEKVLIDIIKNINPLHYAVTLLLEYREGVYVDSIPQWIEVKAMYKRNNIWLERFHRGLRLVGAYHWFHSIIYRFAFLWLMKGRKFDTIVSFMEGESVRIHSYLAKKAVKNISWVHIDFARKHWSLAFFKGKRHEYKCYSLMDKVVFVSDRAKNSFLNIYPIANEKSSVLYNLIDVAEIRKQASSMFVEKRKLTICMVGRLNQQKRYDRAIEVARLLKKNGYNVDFWILGIGELEEEIRNQIKEYNLEDVVILKGFVKPPFAYVAQADIFLNTSESEGYPLTICEAMCLGVPVVATSITGATEILGHSKYGILVEEDVLSIYNRIKLLLDNENIRKEYAEKALDRAKMFQVAETMTQIYSILK